MKLRKDGGEKIPLIHGKEQWLSLAGAAVKRYPMSKVRGSGRDCQAATAQERPGGATPRPRSGAVAESARLRQRRSSQEELPHVPGAVAVWAQEGLEELFHVQGQEGQPVRRYPSLKVRSSG